MSIHNASSINITQLLDDSSFSFNETTLTATVSLAKKILSERRVAALFPRCCSNNDYA